MTVISIHDSLEISWFPPLFSNGIITSYYIKVVSLQSETSITESNISDIFYINHNLSEYSIIVINFCMSCYLLQIISLKVLEFPTMSALLLSTRRDWVM